MVIIGRYIKIAAAVIGIIIVGAALYYFAYLPTTTPPAGLVKVTAITMVPPEYGYWEWSYADYAGLYQEEGLEVEIAIVGTISELIAALATDQAEFTFNVEDSIGASMKGVPIKVVLINARSVLGFTARPGIETIRDVKKIGVLHGDIIVVQQIKDYFHSHGLEENEDYVFVRMAWPAALPALLEGEIDATSTGGGSTAQALQAGGKVLFGFPEEFPNHSMLGLVATDKVIAEKPEVVKAMVKALYRSHVYLMEHREEALDYAVNVLGLEQQEAVFIYEFGYEGKYIGDVRIVPDLPLEMLEESINFIAEVMGIEETPIEQVADFSFIEDAKKELGIS